MNDRSHEFFDDINDVIHEVRQYDKYSQPVHGAVDAVREIVKENERLHASSNAARLAAGYMHADTSAPFAEFLKSQREELEALRADLARVSTDKFAGHTPGPWGVVQYGIDTYEVFAGAARFNCLNWDTFSLADAELIAAAPELLAENERLRAEIENLRNRVAHLEESEADAYLKNQLDGCHP